MVTEMIQQNTHPDGIGDLGKGGNSAMRRKAVQTDEAKQ